MSLYKFVDYTKLKQCAPMTERSRLFTGYGCNIKCKFCFYKDEKHVDIKDKIYQQLEQGKRFGIKDWDITGGEPTILPYFTDLLKDMREKYKFRNIAVITNGYKFANPDFAFKNRVYLNEVLFTLLGMRRHIHDGMTGVKGSWDRIMMGISHARYYGYKIRINTVVTKDNYKQLPEMADYVTHLAKPVAFNFLPYRIENSAPKKKNIVRYSEIAPYIKEAIDKMDNRIKIAIRYVPFCLFEGYEEYVQGYLQREFDEYEWNEYTVRRFDCVRENKDVPELDCESDKWELELKALQGSINHVANHATSCLKCKYLKVCDGIWKSYAKVWGIEEFKPIEGEKTDRICI